VALSPGAGFSARGGGGHVGLDVDGGGWGVFNTWWKNGKTFL